MLNQKYQSINKLGANRGSILSGLLLLIIGSALAAAALLVLMIAVTLPKLPSMDELHNYQPKLPLQVYSVDGVLLGEFGQEHRIYIGIESTPKMLINAILSAEDERFYEHGGIDFLGIVRAAVGNLVSGHIQSGASTITMQVARNFFLSSQKTFTRKFNEVLLSYKIEKSLTKDQILTLYINQIYLGQRAYGFAEAAEIYFGKNLAHLSLAEYAVLAGLPKAPSAFNPVVNKKRSYEREGYVLGRMLKHGYITEGQYKTALAQKINVIKGSIKDTSDAGGFVAEMVRLYLYPTYGDAIYTKGFKVYTTINSKLQQAAYVALRRGILNYDASHGYRGAEAHFDLSQTMNNTTLEQLALSQFDGVTDYGDLLAAIVIAVDSEHIEAILRNGSHLSFANQQLDSVRKFLTSGGNKQIQVGSLLRVHQVGGEWSISQLPQVQGALVAMDPTDGAVQALMGGFDFTLNSFNHIMQAKRQPGSSFKPFIYSAALEHGFTTKTVIDDSGVCFPGGNNGSPWCPKNDDSKFLGPISLRQALTLSRNMVTVKILHSISPQYALEYITKFGFDKSQFQPYLTMALGANEVTPMQMAQAYAVFANGGYLVQPYFIAKITDANGKVLAETQASNIANQDPVIDPRNAFIMNSILKDVAKYGTGARAWRELKRSDVAGKTGTTNDAKDVWFDGYTPDLVAITWVGYDQPKSLGRQFGATLALPIWIDFMRSALLGVAERQLPMPDGIKVEPGATWKGDNEYTYSTSRGVKVNASDGASDNNEENDASAPVSGAEPDASAPVAQPLPSEIEDIIKNIQD